MALLDSYVLGTSTTFQQRVEASMLAACVSIASEGIAPVNHQARLQLVHSILSGPVAVTNYTQLFALSVATDPTVLADATQNGTVTLSGANVAAQEALVTDAHINAAVSGQFNAYCQQIGA